MGRKPIDFRHLDLWDAEWYLAFCRLREGGELPLRTNQWWTRRQLGFSIPERLALLKSMTLEEYWAYLLLSEGHPPDPAPPPLAPNREQAEKLRAGEIAALTRWAEPAVIKNRQKGFEIWEALWKARNRSAVENACRRWSAFGTDQVFPTHLLTKEKQFLEMKREARFPRSEFADDARLTYLSAGMAGALAGISSKTAIHRLRTMKHAPGGPLWNENARRCECWRCDRDREMKSFDAIVDAARRRPSSSPAEGSSHG